MYLFKWLNLVRGGWNINYWKFGCRDSYGACEDTKKTWDNVKKKKRVDWGLVTPRKCDVPLVYANIYASISIPSDCFISYFQPCFYELSLVVYDKIWFVVIFEFSSTKENSN